MTHSLCIELTSTVATLSASGSLFLKGIIVKKILFLLIASSACASLMGMNQRNQSRPTPSSSSSKPSIQNNRKQNISIPLPKGRNKRQEYEQLNLDDIEMFSQLSFREFIQENLGKGNAPVLARVTTSQKPNRNNGTVHYFDQNALHQYLLDDPPTDFKASNEYKNPITTLPIQKIDYFSVTAAKTAVYTHSYRHILKAQDQCKQETQDQELLHPNIQNAPTTMNDEEPLHNAPCPIKCIVYSTLATGLCGFMLLFAIPHDTLCLPDNLDRGECYPETRQTCKMASNFCCDLCNCITQPE